MNKTEDFYDGVAGDYHLQYERDLMYDLDQKYPANYFRVHLLLNSFIKNKLNKIIEVGVGEGTPLVTMAKAGFDVYGFDISKKMVDKSKENFKKNKLDPNNIIFGDIQDPITYSPILENGQFDGLLAMGVMPHVENDQYVLENMINLVRPGGKVFIEFRNKLFSLTTLNSNTYDFFMDDLFVNTKGKLRDQLSDFLKSKLEMNHPKKRIKGNADDDFKSKKDIGYDSILSKFHNPFEVLDLFKSLNFKDSKLLWYHYHPSVPFLETKNKKEFRNQGISYEHEKSGWRGMFLCSAFVVEATVPKSED
tara:strand:- start:678 stop:1595 length:918 start_codon:yes stop_codon:yes gene_type:complete